MKKIKLFLATAAILAAGSAFIPSPGATGDIYVKDGTQFLLKSTQAGACVDMTNSACNYELRPEHSPIQESDFIYSTSENSVWQPE